MFHNGPFSAFLELILEDDPFRTFWRTLLCDVSTGQPRPSSIIYIGRPHGTGPL